MGHDLAGLNIPPIAQYVFDPERVAEPRSGRVWTTVMIRNIPNKYTQSYLLRHLELGGCK